MRRTWSTVEEMFEGEAVDNDSEEVAPLLVIRIFNILGYRNERFNIGDGVGKVKGV